MNIFLKKVEDKDMNQLFKWLNNEDSLSAKILSDGLISLDEHKKWFNERLKDEDTFMWIIQNEEDKSIGQIRFEKKVENYLDVDIYISSEARKHGIATKALDLAKNQINNKSLRAIVKKNNLPSYKLFKNNGFILLCEDKLKWVLIKN